MEAAGIEEIVDPTLALYAEEARKLFTTLEQSWEAGQAEEARRAAHTLKASSANIHAHELSRFVEGLELAAAEGNLTGSMELLETARREYRSVMTYLAEQGYGA